MSVAQEKLEQLVQGGLGAKVSYIHYVEGNIFQSFASAGRNSVGTMFLDTNPELDPVTALQKAVMSRWPVKELCGEQQRELGGTRLLVVDRKPFKPGGKPSTGYLMAAFIHEPSKMEGEKRVWQKPSGRLKLTDRFVAAMSQAIDLIQKDPMRYGNIGMPVIGNAKTWSNLESALEDLCAEKNFNGKILVFKNRRKGK